MNSKHVSRALVPQVIALTGFNALINIELLSPLTIAIILGLLIYRYSCYRFNLALPNRWIKWFLSISAISVAFFFNTGTTGPEKSIALLAVALSLKLLETVKYRDVMITLMGCIYLLTGRALNDISSLSTFIIVIDVFFIFSLMLKLHIESTDNLRFRVWIWPITKLLLKASPLIILLFVVFPRFNFNIFTNENSQNQQTGFSNDLNPGDVSNLARSFQLAFRAKFPNQDSIDEQSLYWRGGVLTQSLGLEWRQGPLEKPSLPLNQDPNFIDYEVLLEPQYGKWLFALEHTNSMALKNSRTVQRIERKAHQSFQLRRPAFEAIFYSGKANLKGLKQSSAIAKENYLKAPTPSEKVSQLLKELKNQGHSSALSFARALELKFKEVGLRYTLSPGRVRTIDELLFIKKRGFCEHFAAAYATLMRQAGFPARVVIGFQGGLKNLSSNYYIISSQDAHAWTEIWDSNTNQWIRKDPTQIIAPLRFQLGGQEYFSLDESFRNLSMEEIQSLKSPFGKWWGQFKMQVDSISYTWDLFLHKYDLEFQKNLLKNLGLNPLWALYVILTGVFLFLIYKMILFYLKKYFFVRVPPETEIYKQLQNICFKKGLMKKPNEGPLEFRSKCIKTWPEQKNSFDTLFNFYLQAHFSHQTPPHDDWLLANKELKTLKRKLSNVENITP